jgi:hypothetical protein
MGELLKDVWRTCAGVAYMGWEIVTGPDRRISHKYTELYIAVDFVAIRNIRCHM